jgi:hypothetical protein
MPENFISCQKLSIIVECEGKLMKKLLAIVGIILVFGGFLSYLALFNYSERRLQTEQYHEENTWNIAWNVSKGENLSMSFRPDADWSLFTPDLEPLTLPPYNETFQYVKSLLIRFTNSAGNSSIITQYLVITELNGGASKIFVYPDYMSVDNQGGLITEEGYPKFAIINQDDVVTLGKMQYSGNYVVNCTLDPLFVYDNYATNGSLWVHEASLPLELRLYKQKEVVQYSYRSPLLLPASSSVSAIGGVVAVSGVLSKRGKRNKRALSLTDKR